MQDRYAGDIGDYGKFGFLKALEWTGLAIGVNWYLTFPDSRENLHDDGRYRIPPKYFSCDQQLAATLQNISISESDRSIKALEQAALLKTSLYYREPVSAKEKRTSWHQGALNALQMAEVVFLDPDNGLQVKSVGENSKRAVKYVFGSELVDYLERGQVVVFYQHRPRKKPEAYFQDMNDRIHIVCNGLNPQLMVLTFPKCSIRDFFIVCPDDRYSKQLQIALKSMLNGAWGRAGIVRNSEK